MLTIEEHRMLSEAVDAMDDIFTDDIIDKGEFFDIEEDPVTLQTTVTIYDANNNALSTATVDDYDVALTYLEDVFDLEWIDDEEE